MSGLLVKSDLCKELIANLFRTGAGSVPVDLEKKANIVASFNTATV